MQLRQQNPLRGDWIKSDFESLVVATYDEKKIGAYNKEDMEKLVELVGKWRFMIGATAEAKDVELIVACQFIYDHYGHLTIADVNQAMVLAVKDTFDIKMSLKTISTAYIAKCLNGWEEIKRKAVNEIAAAKEKHELSAMSRVEVSPEKKAAMHKDYVAEIYTKFKATGNLYDFGDTIYDWLRKKAKVLAPKKEVVDAALSYANDRMIQLRQSESEEFKKMSLGYGLNEEDKRKKFAREYILKEYFKANDLSTIIGLIKPEHFQ